MTAANMARYKNDQNYAFWKMLKQGYDAFEATKVPPKVDVCEKRYVFNVPTPNGQPLSATDACPPSANAELMAYTTSYEKTFQSAFSAAQKKPAPSIQGLTEAKLVSAWSAARARGEKVTREPPSLSPSSAETPNAPDIAPAATPISVQPNTAIAATPAVVDATQTASVPVPQQNPATVSPMTTANTVAETVAAPAPEKKKAWWKLGGN